MTYLPLFLLLGRFRGKVNPTTLINLYNPKPIKVKEFLKEAPRRFARSGRRKSKALLRGLRFSNARATGFEPAICSVTGNRGRPLLYARNTGKIYTLLFNKSNSVDKQLPIQGWRYIIKEVEKMF